MLNNTVRASGEAMPVINRRKALSLAGVCALAVGVAGMATTTAEAVECDPLADAINSYNEAIERFNRLPIDEVEDDEDAAVAATYGPFLDALCNPPEATTARGAAAAIRYALDTYAVDGDDAKAVLNAALAYLDREAV